VCLLARDDDGDRQHRRAAGPAESKAAEDLTPSGPGAAGRISAASPSRRPAQGDAPFVRVLSVWLTFPMIGVRLSDGGWRCRCAPPLGDARRTPPWHCGWPPSRPDDPRPLEAGRHRPLDVRLAGAGVVPANGFSRGGSAWKRLRHVPFVYSCR
jgi:hypothetical protein